MKTPRLKLSLVSVLAVVVFAELLRHFFAGSNVIASLLSARTAGFHANVAIAITFVASRLVTLWLVPALVLTWSVAWLLRRR